MSILSNGVVILHKVGLWGLALALLLSPTCLSAEDVVYWLSLPDGTTQFACGVSYELLEGGVRPIVFTRCVGVFSDGFE